DEVPLDPNIFLYDEEIIYAARAFTYGWDVYHPLKSLCFHHWERTYRATIFDDKSNWYDYSMASNAYVRQMLGMDKGRPLKDNKCKFGKKRSLEEFELRAGINLKERSITHNAKQALFDFDSTIAQLRKNRKEAAKPVIQNIQDHSDGTSKARLLNVDYFARG